MESRSEKRATEGNTTFFEYLDFLKTSDSVAALPAKDYSYYLDKYSFVKSIIQTMPCAVYILDYRTRQYLFVTESCKNIIGFTASEIMEKGNELFVERIHPDDLAIFSGSVFANFVQYTRSLPKDEIHASRFSLNYRFRRKDGEYIHFLQQYVIIESDEAGNPLLTLGVGSDVSAHKSDNKVVFAISRNNDEKGFVSISSDSFPQMEIVLSGRETEVLKLIVSGMTSRAIADELFISLFTVRAHRRNIMEKTNSKNTAELIAYSIRNGLLAN